MRIATSSRASAPGRAPATSARPPVLISGKISEAIERTAQRGHLAELVDHRLGDQGDAVFRAAEALGVELRVLADHEPVGDDDAGVDHRLAQPRRAADLRVGQDDRLVDGRIGMHAHAGEQQRTRDRRAGNDAAARHQRRDRDAAPAVDVVHELGRRRDLAVGPDRPGAVVEIEVGDDVGQVDVGRPIGVDRADVAPVDVRLLAGDDAGLREMVRDRFAVGDEVGNDVLAEIVRRIGIGRRRA